MARALQPRVAAAGGGCEVKIYTRRGDDGTTSLIGGRRVSKAAPRVEAYGTLDALATEVGVVLAFGGLPDGLAVELEAIQGWVMASASLVAAEDDEARQRVGSLPEDLCETLERSMDAMDQDLPRLTMFVRPGGSMAGALLHRCRVICREAERRVVALQGAAGPGVVEFLNRLSDWFFVAARWANHRSGVGDAPWEP